MMTSSRRPRDQEQLLYSDVALNVAQAHGPVGDNTCQANGNSKNVLKGSLVPSTYNLQDTFIQNIILHKVNLNISINKIFILKTIITVETLQR